MNRLPANHPTSRPRLLRLDAAGVADGAGVSAAPGSLIVESDDGGFRVLFAGESGEADRHPASGNAERAHFPHHVLVPAFVNAHCHLDLTHVGPRPHRPQDGFVSWIRMVIRERRTDEAGTRASVREGLARSLAGGVAAVGDIAGAASRGPWEESVAAGVGGVSYLEFFGIGKSGGRGSDEGRRLAGGSAEGADGGMGVGVSPHAPYTVGHEAFRACDVAGVIGATHVSESIEELELIERGRGPFREFLEGWGLWEDRLSEWFGRGAHPVDLTLDALGGGGRGRWVFAHVNHAGDAQIERLAASGVSVAYCPRGHAYFGHAMGVGPHPWQRLVEAGVNVCLGTDSVINLPAGAESARITPLDDARFLWRESGHDARSLLRMITSNAARALGLRAAHDFKGGLLGGVVGVDVRATDESVAPEERVMASDGGVTWVTRGREAFGGALEALSR